MMSGIIAYIIRPIVLGLEKRNIPRAKGVMLVYLIGIITSLVFAIFIVPILIENTRELANTFPQISTEYKNKLNDMAILIDTSGYPADVKNMILKEVNNVTGIIENRLANTLRNISVNSIKMVARIGDFIIAMIIAYHLTKDSRFFKNYFISLIPRGWRGGIIAGFREIDDIMLNFIQGQILASVIIGFMEMIIFLVIGIRYAPILGIIGGISNIIPYFGPFIGAIPAVAITLIDSPAKTLWVIVSFIVVQQIDNAFISPKIIEGKLGIHPVMTILMVMIWGKFFGIIGMLVAIPITAVMRVIFKRLINAIV